MKYSFPGAMLLFLAITFSSCGQKTGTESCRDCIGRIADSEELLAYKNTVDTLLKMILLENIDMTLIQKIVASNPGGLSDEESARELLAEVKGGGKLISQVSVLQHAKKNLQAKYDYLTLSAEKRKEVDRLFTQKHSQSLDVNSDDGLLEHRLKQD